MVTQFKLGNNFGHVLRLGKFLDLDKTRRRVSNYSLISRVYHFVLRADVSKYQPEVYKSEKSKILRIIHKVALGKLLT